MNIFTIILTNLQGAIAARAAREPALVVLLVAVWGRIARMRVRLERLIALWRAGRLPTPRRSRAGEARVGVRTKSIIPTTPAWLVGRVREAAAFGSQLEHALSQAEWEEFLIAVPQAGRIFRPLRRMLGVGVRAVRVRQPRQVWLVDKAAPVVAGLVVGVDGRLRYV